MIQPLRTLHRWIFIALALILTAVLIAAIRAQRPPIPNNPAAQVSSGNKP